MVLTRDYLEQNDRSRTVIVRVGLNKNLFSSSICAIGLFPVNFELMTFGSHLTPSLMSDTALTAPCDGGLSPEPHLCNIL